MGVLLEKAEKPIILAGVEFHRFKLQDKLLKLLEVKYKDRLIS